MPRGLTFGPTNGPEDFQELVFTVFQRRLYKDWFLFVDDLSVATGRKKCYGDEPSGAHDIACLVRADTEGEKGCIGRDISSGAAFPSPFAHANRHSSFLRVWLIVLLILGLCLLDNRCWSIAASGLIESLGRLEFIGFSRFLGDDRGRNRIGIAASLVFPWTSRLSCSVFVELLTAL